MNFGVSLRAIRAARDSRFYCAGGGRAAQGDRRDVVMNDRLACEDLPHELVHELRPAS